MEQYFAPQGIRRRIRKILKQRESLISVSTTFIPKGE
jgi:hypothetical protein